MKSITIIRTNKRSSNNNEEFINEVNPKSIEWLTQADFKHEYGLINCTPNTNVIIVSKITDPQFLEKLINMSAIQVNIKGRLPFEIQPHLILITSLKK
jgi:hypothetical protein